MNVLVPSPESFDDYHPMIRYEQHSNITGMFGVGDSVKYFSSTHQKWVQTRVVRVRSGRSVDLSCRKNVDVSLIQRTASTLRSNASTLHDFENMPPVTISHGTVMYAIGTKVEYLSESMNGWIQSLVRGHNADGTYILNTKKTAQPTRVRLLLVNSDPKKSVKQVHPISILSTVHVQIQSSDLLVYTAHILGALNLTFDHGLVKMKGLTGGQNEGIYFITSPPEDTRKYCLKVVKSVRVFPSIPTEREKYLELMQLYPNELSRDKRISFPIRILQFQATSPYDVIVMECAKGERMAELIARLVLTVDKSSLANIFERVGIELKKFHSRYGGLQHGDLQVSNIYVDKTSVMFIDVGGMSRNGDDVDYFVKSITILAKTYGPEFEVIARSSFNRGYSIA